MATLQNTSTSTTLRSTGAVRSSRTPSATVRGAARTEPSDPAQTRPGGDRTGLAHQQTVSTRCATLSAMASQNGSSSGLVRPTGARRPGHRRPSAPTAMARPSTVPARASARSTGMRGDPRRARRRRTRPPADRSPAPGRCPAGPQARTKTPKLGREHEQHRRGNADQAAGQDQHRTAAQRVGQPPVGSSRASTTKPWVAMAIRPTSTEAQPALQHQQGGQPDDQTHREPAGGGEQQQGSLRGGGGDRPRPVIVRASS